MSFSDVFIEDYFVMSDLVSQSVNWFCDFFDFASHIFCFCIWEIFFPVRECIIDVVSPESLSIFVECCDPESEAKFCDDLVLIIHIFFNQRADEGF